MGILGSFNIGVTGLQSVGSGMSVIADNIANSGTNGFKASRGEFQDVFASSLKGIDGGDQIGSGTKLAHVKPVFTQGTLVRTDNVTDISVNGNGFFAVEAPFGRGFTRDGSFQFDRSGFLTTADGYQVLGYTADETGITNKVAPLKLGGTTLPAQATENVSVQMNLDSRAELLAFDPKNPEKTTQFSTGVTVFDNIGTAHMVNLYFNKVGENNWEYRAMIDSADSANGKAGSNEQVECAKGQLVFNNKGQLQREVEQSNSFNFSKGASPDQKIKFDFGKSIEEGGTGFDATTQYGSNTAVERHNQDGESASSLASLSFNDDGVLTAVYSNGEMRDLGQVALARFENNEGLFKMGKNVFKATRKSGPGSIGKPREGGRGEVLSKSLEESNVDIANEFIQLMKAQRNFTANTRTITTSDQMLQDILNLKR